MKDRRSIWNWQQMIGTGETYASVLLGLEMTRANSGRGLVMRDARVADSLGQVC